jgi:hypothetical protein
MTFEHSILIRASPEEVFALTQDYALRLEWDCFLRSAYLLNGMKQPTMGDRAVCVAKSGMAMQTEYISFRPPWVTAIKMTRGPWFLGGFAGCWRFREERIGETRVSFKYHLRARPWWLSPALNPILAWIFARDTEKRLKALREAVDQRGLRAGTALRCARRRLG